MFRRLQPCFCIARLVASTYWLRACVQGWRCGLLWSGLREKMREDEGEVHGFPVWTENGVWFAEVDGAVIDASSFAELCGKIEHWLEERRRRPSI